jgi:type IV pilus assembly protein PilA
VVPRHTTSAPGTAAGHGRQAVLARKRRARAFSLVELVAVVLILAVLVAVAVPLYMLTQKQSVARACKANLAAIARAQTAYALRKGGYANQMSKLVGASEGFSAAPTCPLNQSAYTLQNGQPNPGELTISCPNATLHASVLGASTEYSHVLGKSPTDALP